MIRIAIVEDIPKLSEALKEKIELTPEMTVKSISCNGKEIISQLNKDHGVDVILMDINMPVMDGIEATAFISKRWPNIKIIMITVFSDDQNLFDAIMAGATGYLLKDETPAIIHKSVYEALDGGAPMSKEMALKSLQLIRSAKPSSKKSVAEEYGLTQREVEILEHISKGNTYEQVADNLFISYGTVRKHVENCYKKLRVHSKVEAINKFKNN